MTDLADGKRRRPFMPTAAVSRLRLLPASAAAVACVLVLGSILWHQPILLLWNASPSSPVGLYAVDPWARPRAGHMAVAWPPDPARRLAAARNYLPAGVPLVKHVAAGAGSRVCAAGTTISIDGRPVALRRPHDRGGRRLPWWTGCRRLANGELFLLNPDVRDSFDGRYFGVTDQSEILGRGRLVWHR